MGYYDLKYKTLGEGCAIVEWPVEISSDILIDIVAFKQVLLKKLGASITEGINTYNSLSLFYQGQNHDELVERIKDLYEEFEKPEPPQSRVWEIPVCYDPTFGIDLGEMAETLELSPEEIVSRHHSNHYTVYFIGFLPGFLYLGGLDPSIEMARKAVPRSSVSRGSVGIAGAQTAVYPTSSPAGWNIIGNSPVPFFDPFENPPCFANPGDKVRFVPIDMDEHTKIREEVKAGNFKLNAKTG